MENENLQENPEMEEQQPAYVPRPAWQVWGARIALVLFIILIIMYYLNIARGNI